MKKARFSALPLAAVLSLGALVACGEDDTVVGDAEERGVAFEAALLGEPVTVQSEVQDVISDRIFTVGANDTLVVSAGTPVEEGTEVQVTGTVRSFVLVDVEEELGVDFDADEEEYVVDFEQRLAIVADDVTLLQP